MKIYKGKDLGLEYNELVYNIAYNKEINKYKYLAITEIGLAYSFYTLANSYTYKKL